MAVLLESLDDQRNGLMVDRPALAPYAAIAGQSRGRLFAEPSSPTRTDFQRDRDRIIHSDA